MRIFKRGAFSHLVWGDLKQREIVLNWKKEGNRLLKEGKEPKELKLDFKLLAEFLASEGVLDFDIITIPPPSFHEFEKDKGWYPAEIMAKKLCKQMGAKELQLLWPERYKDKKAKFMAANINKVYPPPAINVKGRFVFILDDIATTGLTLSAACKAVVEAGGYPFCMGFV